MSLDDWRIVFFSTGLIVILIIILPAAWGFFPRNEEQFMAMAILGEGMTEGKYFPDDNSNVTLGEVMKWNIYLYNHMDSSQYILVKVKALDSHILPPNNTLGTPSTAPSIYEFGRILAKNETAIIPFQWSIVNASISSNSLIITKMGFYGHSTDLIVNLAKGDKLRLILELWLYNTNSRTFKFNTGIEEDPRIVWNQIWFDLLI